MTGARARRAGKRVVVVAALAGALVGGCRKKAPPAPVVEPAGLETRVGQLADSLRLLGEAQRDLALRVDSLEALQSQRANVAARSPSTSRRRADSSGGAGAAGEASTAGSDTLSLELDRQKVIFANYEMLQRQGFQGDTIPAFLTRKYGVDSSTVEAIRQRGEEQGW
jgi:hypothetical protein